MRPQVLRAQSLLVSALLLVACSDSGHVVRGIVRDVDPETAQIVIEHEDIPGLMPAMTMSFDVADIAILEGVDPGQPVDFLLETDGEHFRITRIDALGQSGGGAASDSPTIAGLRAEEDIAPEFVLVDQAGEPLALSDLRGKVVLLDFIYTHCPGPCPIVTGTHVSVQRALPPELRAKTWFVSVSLDPERDTPEAMRAYARARGADLASWSFVTGDAGVVSDVVREYGVGSIRKPDGEVDHMVVSFLIDAEGRIARRFIGLEHEPQEITAGIRGLQ